VRRYTHGPHVRIYPGHSFQVSLCGGLREFRRACQPLVRVWHISHRPLQLDTKRNCRKWRGKQMVQHGSCPSLSWWTKKSFQKTMINSGIEPLTCYYDKGCSQTQSPLRSKLVVTRTRVCSQTQSPVRSELVQASFQASIASEHYPAP
jgi:hypothetical protein